VCLIIYTNKLCGIDPTIPYPLIFVHNVRRVNGNASNIQRNDVTADQSDKVASWPLVIFTSEYHESRLIIFTVF